MHSNTFAQYLYNICAIFEQYLNNICTIFAQYLHNICTIWDNTHSMTLTKFAQYWLNICKTFARCRGHDIWAISSNIPTILAHYSSNFRTIFEAIRNKAIYKISGKKYLLKICIFWHNICTIYDNICKMFTQYLL